MPFYLVNKQAQPNGDHVVHHTECGLQPLPENAQQLGYHAICYDAVVVARLLGYKQLNGCRRCTTLCYKE